MKIKQYAIGMLIVALPATIFGVILAIVTTHSGGILFKVSFVIVPGLWFIDKLGITENNYAWPIALFLQSLYWSVIIAIFYLIKNSNEKNYRLYIGSKQLYLSSFEEAKIEAKKHMQDKPELRIEILIETKGADFWAYEYNKKRWVPS